MSAFKIVKLKSYFKITICHDDDIYDHGDDVDDDGDAYDDDVDDIYDDGRNNDNEYKRKGNNPRLGNNSNREEEVVDNIPNLQILN